MLYNSRSIRYQIIQRGRVHCIWSLYVHVSIQRCTIERYCTSIFDNKVFTNHFLQTKFIYSLIDPVITKHFHIALIIKFRPDISRTFSADIISGNRVHNDSHGGIGSCIHENIQTDICFLLFLLLTFLLYLFVIWDYLNRILDSTTRCFIHEFDKLIASSRCYTTINIGKGSISICSHGHIYIEPLYGVSREQYIPGTIYRTIERHICRFFCVHHKHIICLYLETIV